MGNNAAENSFVYIGIDKLPLWAYNVNENDNIFRAGCDSPPAVQSANAFQRRNGEIPLPTVNDSFSV